MSINRVFLMGQLTREVALRHVHGNIPVAELGLAINERVRSGDAWRDNPVFVDVTAWRQQAEIAAEYLQQGDFVVIEGRLKFDQRESQRQEQSRLSVVCEQLHLIPKAQGRSKAKA